MMSSKVIFVLGLLGAVLTANAWEWSYSKKSSNGPKDWVKNYPDCGGKRQSPIDLKDFTPASKPKFIWSRSVLDHPKNMTIRNSGRTLVLTSEGHKPTITMGHGKDFQLSHAQFHWGRSQRDGSDHALMGNKYSLEMQVLLVRIDSNGTEVSPIEIVIISELFGETTNKYGDDFGLAYFIKKADEIIDEGDELAIEPFAWSSLINIRRPRYYSYEGSLTTPPCTEAVTYFINIYTRTVSATQMSMFRLLLDEDEKPISGNFRPLQDRGDRKVLNIV